MSEQEHNAKKGLGEAPWLCDCPLSLVGKHRDSCLHERLERVERLLIQMTTITPAAACDTCGGPLDQWFGTDEWRSSTCVRCTYDTATPPGGSS